MAKPSIAAIVTEYRPNSHADVIVGKFLRGFPTDDGLLDPRVDVCSMYLDQVNPEDTGVSTAKAFGVPIYPSIRRALTLGGEELAVDGVLLIGEHGDYPLNEAGQKLYPRRHFCEQICGVFASSGRSVPVFCDKHLSYNWPDALWMYTRARQLGVPLMAGSSLPVCWRKPALDIALGSDIEAALVIGYGPVESYGFHALETLQCMVERRGGGEIGVAAVQALSGQDVWAWLEEHEAYRGLADQAAHMLAEPAVPWQDVVQAVDAPVAYIVEYADGLVGAVLMLNGFCRSFSFAARVNGQELGCEFVLQAGNSHAHFAYLSLNVEEMYLSGEPSYPVERTLLTTGVLAAGMGSLYTGGTRVETDHLAIAYTPVEEPLHRPSGIAPSGATLWPWPPEAS